MSFLTARAASRTLCRGTILIYNFSMEANGRRRYRRRQPPENKLTFLLHFYPQFSVMASFPETMCGFIGVDVSCQSNIRGTGNWQRIWWGNPHAYISADKGAVATSLRLSFASFASSFLSASHASPWNSPLLSSQEELLCFLSFMLQLHLPPHWKGGGDSPLCSLTVKRLHQSSWRFNYFIHRLLNNSFTSSAGVSLWVWSHTVPTNYTLSCLYSAMLSVVLSLNVLIYIPFWKLFSLFLLCKNKCFLNLM